MRYRWAVSLSLGLLLFLAWSNPLVSANLSGCEADASPNQINIGSTADIQIDLQNTDVNDIQWIQINVPSGNFNIANVNADGWDNTFSNGQANLTNGDLGSGSSLYITVTTTAANTQDIGNRWTVQASDDPGGANAVTCYGSHELDAVIPPPVITNIQPSSLTTSSVTISWDTNTPTEGNINYGTTSDYGSATPTETNFDTTHQQTITDLTANTGYHFQIYSQDQYGNTTNSDDNTFLTPIQSEPSNNSGPSTSSTSPSNNNPIGLTITNPADNIPPIISFTNLPSVKVFKSAPTLTGQASDNVAVQRIEYSTDNGQDWLPVNSAPKLNTSQTNFSFTPINLADGTYKIMARAVNDGDYTTNTPEVTVVIDSLPPIVGGNLLSLGPQVLVPNSNGIITSLAGVDQKFTLSAVGGPTNIDLTAQKIGSKTSMQIFELTESPDTLLWSGIVSIDSSGQYNLIANAVDGAGISTTQVVSTMNIISDPHTYNQNTHQPIQSTITLYYQDPDSHNWEVWDGNSYGEANPQTTNSRGNFKLFVPPGSYYLEATAPGYETLISSIFKTTESEPLTTNLGLKPLVSWSIGPLHISLPSLAIQNINIKPQVSSTLSTSLSRLVGQPLPDFSLADTNGTTVHAADLLGRPTLISLGSTWSPNMAEQLSILSSLQSNQNLNIVPIALQQNLGQVQAYTAIAGLNLNWLVDPTSTLTAEYGSPNMPTQLFVDRNGIIRQVFTGILSQSQIENKLGGL
jgi:peroxiredoxin